MLRRCRILSVASYILAAGRAQKAGKFTFCMHIQSCLHRISPASAQLKYIPLITAQEEYKKIDARIHLLKRTKKCSSSFQLELIADLVRISVLCA